MLVYFYAEMYSNMVCFILRLFKDCLVVVVVVAVEGICCGCCC